MTSDFEIGSERSLSKNITNDIYVSAKRWFNKLDPGELKLKSYREGIEYTLNRVQIMGMSSDRKITHIYVSLKFYPGYRKLVDSFKSLGSSYEHKDNVGIENNSIVFDSDSEIRRLGYGHLIEKQQNDKKVKDIIEKIKNMSLEKQKSRRNNKKIEILHGLNAFSFVDEQKKLVVLGQPGGGKTTFLKYLALAYTGYVPTAIEINPLIPIFIPLREYSKEPEIRSCADWFLRFASRCVSEISGIDKTNLWIESQLKEGNCLLLVDGIDEVPSDKLSDILSSFKAFSNVYRKNKFVVTCRVASYHHSLDGFMVCEVDDFDDNDIENFALQWFGSESKKKNLFISDLKKSSVAKELCKTPLLATMMCLMYEYNRRIPDARFELYESCVNALMYKWDAFRAIDRSRRVDEISNTRKEYILSNIARKTFDSESIYFKKYTLLKIISNELSLLDIEISAEKVLYDFESNMGVFIERSHDVYCFSHLTFHEYFTALSYLECNEVDKMFDLVFKKPRYMEVFLLAMEKMYLPDKVGVMLAGRIEYSYLRESKGSSYHRSLIWNLLKSQAVFSKSVRSLLREILKQLDTLDALSGVELFPHN